MSALLVRGGRVVDPSQSLDAVRDVLLRDGIVAEIGEHLEAADARIFDATNAIVAPGFIDMHVHLREPGQTHKETIATGSAAAVAGGFTAVACMPNTEPALDSAALIAEVRRLAEAAGLARIYPIAAITRARAGKELAPYWRLHDAGAVAFSDDGTAVANPRVLRQAALYARDVPGVFISHCDDEALRGDAVMNEGPRSFELGLAGAPGLSEDVNVARDVLICGDTGKAFHIAHLSTAMSVELMRFGRAQDMPVTCEVTPHHLCLDDSRFDRFRADVKVNPPLRRGRDVRALRDAVRDGTIDVFATDHAPHTREEKAQLLAEAPVGFSGLEIAIGAYAFALPDLPLARFVALLSTNPARILGVAGGTLRVGSQADVTIFADRDWRVESANFHSLGKNTPFDGEMLPRRALATIVAGEVVMHAGLLNGRGLFAYKCLASLMLLSLGAAAPDAERTSTLPSAEAIFGQAKGVWRGRVEAPYVRYSLLERYTWRKRVHENWWRAAYRDRDRRLSLHRVIEPGEEAARLRGMSIGINFNLHHSGMHTDSVDTNADADAFPILDPQIDPNASFGLARSDAQPSLVGAKPDDVTLAPAASPSPSPSASKTLAAPSPAETPLRELVRVEAVARDYTIALAGIERVRDQDAYHLTLVPLRQPRTYRLRDLWVATKTFETLKLDVDGLFGGQPYDDARWTVTFVDFNGLAYVQQIRADATLRFGLDRYVDDLEYDFVEYAFPQTMSPMEFDRLL